VDSYIQQLFASRIGGEGFGKDEKIYKFEKIKRAKRAAVKDNPGIALIDLGVGEPDQTADISVIKSLQEEAPRPENRGYADNGIDAFKEAAALYLKNVFGVDGIDPSKEIMHAIGSKSALSMMPSVFIDPGDAVLMTIPGYPVLGTHSQWYGGIVHNMPLRKENNFLPDLDAVPADILKKAKMLVINYPNNPTGAVATADFYKRVVDFAVKNKIVVIQDAAYAALAYGAPPLSFLSIPGAKEVGIEIHSLSKAFNMTGWRLAFAAGNELVIKGFANVKDNYDSGQFIAIQKAGITALSNPGITTATAAKYERRLKALVGILNSAGFSASVPGGTFYLYVRIPKGTKSGIRFASAEEFSQYMIKEKLISTVPWDDVENFVRFSATFEADGVEDEKRILEEIRNRFKSLDFEF
jgi:LL-diaminopimelate aminotransferase